MGKHFNPGNEAFAGIIRGRYVDKTGLIHLINETIGKPEKLTCISRPRRFGKSFAAQMLCAYYDCTCDSHKLFEKYEISKLGSYEEHMNKYNVISFDVTGFLSRVKKSNGKKGMSDIPEMITADLRKDLIKEYPDLEKIPVLEDCLLECVKITGRKFVFIIDEWDALIREAKKDTDTQDAYLSFLRGLFKNNDVTPYVIAAAYMTGILPIKKDGSQSAISDFREYSMLEPLKFARYVGFCESEVKALCKEASRDFHAVKEWYDGYMVGDERSIYNPYSVMCAMDNGRYRSYWKKTSAAEALMTYIDMDREGLQEDIARLVAGESVEIDTESFQNDFESFEWKDDVLTLLIHLGYLTYEEVSDSYDDVLVHDGKMFIGLVKIPNEEIRTEFQKLLRRSKHEKLIGLVRNSDQLLQDTIMGNSNAVADAIQKLSETNYAPAFRNNEQSLRYLIKIFEII